MRGLALLLGLIAASAAGARAQTDNPDPDAARIITADVERFWRAYDRLPAAATRADSTGAFRAIYYDSASPGLEAFIPTRLHGPDSLLQALTRFPRYYAAIRDNTQRLDAMEGTIREAYRRLEALYPEAVFPDVYFVIGRFASMGTTARAGLLIGAEMISADADTPMDELPRWAHGVMLDTDVVPCLVVHELVHYQQDYAPPRSLLRQALREGVADFLAVQTTGCKATPAAVYRYGEAHEAELWAEFREAMHGTDYGRWLYNGNRGLDRPGDLGYWMGYQIAEAYWERADDERQAVRDMLEITDYDAFLEASGYDGPQPE